MSTCNFLGIFPESIEDAGDSVDNLIKKFGFSSYEEGMVWEAIKDGLKETLATSSMDCSITNRVIYCIFDYGIYGILRVKPELNEEDFDFFVNGSDSHLYYQKEEY